MHGTILFIDDRTLMQNVNKESIHGAGYSDVGCKQSSVVLAILQWWIPPSIVGDMDEVNME